MMLRPGDVLFVWANGWITDWIEAVTDGPSHAAMILDGETVCEAQGGKRVGERELAFYTEGEFERLEVWRDPTLTDADRGRMLQFAATLYGTSYDYLLIPLELAHFGLHLDLSWYQERGHLICSTYLSAIARSVGRSWSKVPNPAPIDLMKSGALVKLGGLEELRAFSRIS